VKLNDLRRQRGLGPLHHGVGVHVGDVVAGNIGTADRAQYTVIGDAVNVAARLESATKEHKVEVLVSADAIAAAGGAALPELRDVGTIQVKGRAAGIPVSTLA
jgi:adenylate cyclase